MQREQYLERPKEKRKHGSFKRKKSNYGHKFKGFKQGIGDHTAFSDRLFWLRNVENILEGRERRKCGEDHSEAVAGI